MTPDRGLGELVDRGRASTVTPDRGLGELVDRGRASGERGQASLELLGALPVLLVVALVAFQLLAVGYASVLAGSAAEAGALAMAAGADVPAGVRESLPGWSRARARVESGRGRVRVRLRPPSPIRLLARKLEVTAEAAVNAP